MTSPERTVHERADVPYLLKPPVAMVLAVHNNFLQVTEKEIGRTVIESFGLGGDCRGDGRVELPRDVAAPPRSGARCRVECREDARPRGGQALSDVVLPFMRYARPYELIRNDTYRTVKVHIRTKIRSHSPFNMVKRWWSFVCLIKRSVVTPKHGFCDRYQRVTYML
eukprot:6179197-Pleurochrysis_carterae.AAC.1